MARLANEMIWDGYGCHYIGGVYSSSPYQSNGYLGIILVRDGLVC